MDLREGCLLFGNPVPLLAHCSPPDVVDSFRPEPMVVKEKLFNEAIDK
jgi:hypothetical protein